MLLLALILDHFSIIKVKLVYSFIGIMSDFSSGNLDDSLCFYLHDLIKQYFIKITFILYLWILFVFWQKFERKIKILWSIIDIFG